VGLEESYRVLRARLESYLEPRLAGILADVPLSDRDALVASLLSGKKIRGVLLCLVCDAFGGETEEALPRAAAVELVQTATLIHDDIVDRDAIRRGGPATWATEGIHRAILVGDLLFASALRMMGESAPEDAAVMSAAIAEIAKGACLEPVDAWTASDAFRFGSDPCGKYEQITRLKTAVLFGAACRMGAYAAGIDGLRAERVERYGVRLGEAFQMADDLEELRGWLASGRVDARAAPPLLPALLAYGAPRAGNRARLLRDLQAQRWESLLPCVRTAAEALSREVERRLASAVEVLDGSLPPTASAALVREAPAGFLRLFQAQSSVRDESAAFVPAEAFPLSRSKCRGRSS
jgi:geranylgeranyl pyrophosphate synthase